VTLLEPLEVATGLLLGPATAAGPRGSGEPRPAFEAAVRRALLRPPCVVSFSGGRDSSAVLAVATHVARREGLPLPIPVTIRFRELPSTNEEEHQDAVIRALDLDEWVRLELDDLDLVGPVAQRALRRHGVLYPVNAHFHVPIFEQAQGGSCLTGCGGDEVMLPWRPTLTVTLRRHLRERRLRPTRRELVGVAPWKVPKAVRVRRFERQFAGRLQWCAEDARREAVARWAERQSKRYLSLERDLRAFATGGYRRVATASLGLLAADSDTEAVHPFFDDEFLRSFGRTAPRAGFTSRTEAMRMLFRDVLPERALSRVSKASFTRAFVTPATVAFAASWKGEGFDPAVVHADRLRDEWLSDRPDTLSFLAMQHAWLSTQATREVPT
jgi:asparagine synthase (glutamine-hydrolysing)